MSEDIFLDVAHGIDFCAFMKQTDPASAEESDILGAKFKPHSIWGEKLDVIMSANMEYELDIDGSYWNYGYDQVCPSQTQSNQFRFFLKTLIVSRQRYVYL